MATTGKLCQSCGQAILATDEADDDRPVAARIAFRRDTTLVLSHGRYGPGVCVRMLAAGEEVSVEICDGYNPDVADLYFADGLVAGGVPRSEFEYH